MDFRMDRGLAACGLACAACSEANCPGCLRSGCKNAETCDILHCAREKGLAGCSACEAFPCDRSMFESTRVRGFVRYARRYGEAALLARLAENARHGIRYHRPGGLQGDYDGLPTEEHVMARIAFGKETDPFVRCPVLKTASFVLRLVEPTDAEALLDCYGDPAAWPIFNADCCTSRFRYTSLEEMQECIDFFLASYADGSFVRWAIVANETGRAIGTAEMFYGDTGVLRLDLASRYERRDVFEELIPLVNAVFPLLFRTRLMITKVTPGAGVRREALVAHRYQPVDLPDREGYLGYTI